MILSMRELNIFGLDLNLLPALDALLRRRNVTHAAADAGLSQPAMSRALARLRLLQDDPLLVRSRAGYVLTPHAVAIQPRVAMALNEIREVFQRKSFDASLERRTLRLAAADGHTILILPGVAARLASEAPGVDLRAETYGPATLARLESGDLDLAFALSSTPLPSGAYSEIVYEDHLALVMRRGHPAARRPWTIADYGAYQHVGVALIGDGRSEIDTLLAAAGVTRRIALVTPHFMAALAAVAESDFVTTVSASLARRFADTFNLQLKKPPFGEMLSQTTLVSSHVRASDPFLGWFREVVREVAASRLQLGA
jgi:DNA-binding transcriptional LysR family regulator